MRIKYLPIFWKLNIILIITIALFGILNIIFVWSIVYEKFESEVINRILNIANNLANQSTHSILYNELSTLQVLVDNSLKTDTLIAYCYIVNDKNEILAHTFGEIVPIGLTNLHKNIPKIDSVSIINITASNYSFQDIKDMRIPILEGKIGYVRMGIKSKVIDSILNQSMIYYILIFISFTILGFLGSYGFSKFLTSPIKNLKLIAEDIDLNNINESKLKFDLYTEHQKNKIYVFDEIDDLMKTFQNMLIRLDQTYNKLLTTQSAMNQSEKLASIGTLVSGLAHEINNPLSGLQSCLRRINDNPDNITQNIKYIEIMNEATFKIKNVVDGLLNFSRVSESKKLPYSIKEIIKSSIKLISFRKTHKNIIIIFDEPEKDLFVLCNKNELEQVLFNLLKNSYDAIDEKFKLVDNFEPKIDIILKIIENKVIIEIIDNGKGISKEHLQRVFDPFFTTKDVGKGTGLGCSICYNIIKDHDGSISVDSKELENTSFKILLPKFE